jgi:serine/threonine protein kinase
VSSPDYTRSSLRGSGLLSADGLESEVSRWELDPSEIELSSELGSGAFGVVYKGKLRGKDVAIKKIKLDGATNNETLDQFRIECAIMRFGMHVKYDCTLHVTPTYHDNCSKLRHPNVLLFMGGSCGVLFSVL